MRFATMHARHKASSTRLRDLSESGLAFVLERLEGHYPDLPDEGDMIKIEFTVPGRKQIACFATVTRVESRHEWSPEFGDKPYLLIAAQFRNLPDVHRRSLHLSLKGRATQDDDGIVNQQPRLTQIWPWQINEQVEKHRDKRFELAAFSGASAALLLCFWSAVQPPMTWVAAVHQLFFK
jgi:hypothetical protein